MLRAGRARHLLTTLTSLASVALMPGGAALARVPPLASAVGPVADPAFCANDGPSAGTPASAVNASTNIFRPGLPFLVVIPGLAFLPGADAPAPPSERFLQLQVALAAEVAGASTPGEFAIAVTDLQSGQTIHVDGERSHRAACVMNLFVIITVLRDVQAGFYPLADVDALIRQTIHASDAVTGRALYEKAGGGDVVAGVARVRELQREVIGMRSTSLDHPPAFPAESLGVSADNLITALDANRALTMLYRGELLNAELTAWLLDAMTGVKPGLNYLTAALPPGATVSHKNGFVPLWDGYVDNDVAIVRFGPGLRYAYAISFFSQGVPVQYADIPVAQALVRTTWEYFISTYE